MIPKTLEEIASYIVKDGKGILAADESTGTIEKDLSQLTWSQLKIIEENIEKCFLDLLLWQKLSVG